MAIKKNLLWDTSDANNNGELVNTNKYYSNQDFIYGNDLNLLFAPLTHALQYYPLYDTELSNNKPQRLTYNDYLLAAYNNETIPTMFRLSYQDTNNTYSGDVNIVFDNQSASNHYTNLIIDGDFKWQNGSLNTFYNDTNSNISSIRNAGTYWRISEAAEDNKLLAFARNQETNTIENSYTEVFSNLRLYTLHNIESEEYGDWNSAEILTLKPAPNNASGTLLLKPGTMATEDYVDNKFARTSNGWMTLDSDHECDYYMGASSTDKVYELKGIYLIEFRNNDGDCDHISTTVMIDTSSADWDIRNHPSSFPNDRAEICVGAFVPAGNYGFDAYASLRYDDSTNGMGYYFKCNGCPRGRTSGSAVIALVYDRVRITKLFSL